MLLLQSTDLLDTMNIIKNFLKKGTEMYGITSSDLSLNDEIVLLKKRVEQLERDNIINLSRIEELERENISSINAMYEIANSLEARIDEMAPQPLDFSDKTIEHF
jgi:DNA polymerase III gamma/tau subunit